jgi:hypothetical protein
VSQFLILWWLTRITEIVQQVTAYRKIFSGGYHHLIHGRTIMLPANHTIAGLQSGSFRAIRFQNGERPKSRVHFYGCMGNVCLSLDFAAQQRLMIFGFAAGAGKSVFWYANFLYFYLWKTYGVVSSTIIEDIRAMRKAGLASLAFFYCDFRDDRKKELRGLLSSFLVQLYHQSDSYFDILSKFYSEHDKGSRPPSDDALAGCLKDLLKLPGLAPVYLIVDAVDECPNPSVVRSPRAEVLSLIKDLVKTQIQNLRMCVTSRPEHDIKGVLDPLIFRSVSLHDEGGQKRDIEDYIKSVINTRTTIRWKDEHRKLVLDVLIKKSNGM